MLRCIFDLFYLEKVMLMFILNMVFVFFYKSLCYDQLVYMNGYVYKVFVDVMLFNINNI